MPLAPGTQLGHYEILALLGTGGMGEVYRARDPKLNREVAIKVLNAAFANDANYLTRFQREAQVLASLNHPNIAAIYGLEQNAIVMELVEGPTLADRIAQGPIPLVEATTLAASIAEALEAAHEKGVVHRDLKPANVKITPAGTVKVLDFGLAKAADPAESSDLSNSPTMSIRATQAGVILGTAGYMSPEQASGKTVDKRADIWSFGVVLWEMLSGRRMFAGETIAHTLAEVLTREADLDALPATTPAAIKDLLRRCLDRNVKTRLRDIGEARILLQSNPTPAPAPKPAARPLPWILATAVAALSAIALGVLHFRESPPEPLVVESEIAPPDKTTFQIGGGSNLSEAGPAVISPDGGRIVFSAVTNGEAQLWIRPIDASVAQPLSGTSGAIHPFWSPDSRYIGFFADEKLKKIDAQGGPPITLCDASTARGGSWNRDGLIIFKANATRNIQRVASAGGTPEPLESDFGNTYSPRWPHFLPDGRHYLVSAGEEIKLASIDAKPSTTLLQARSNAIYSNGHILFLRENTLMAQQFDPVKLALKGEARPIVEAVQAIGNLRRGVFSVSGNGMLVIMHGIGREHVNLEWFERDGRTAGKLTELESASSPEFRISPNQKKLLITQSGADAQSANFLLDLESGVKSHFRDRGASFEWAPDSRSLFFTMANATRGYDIIRKPLGVEPEQAVLSGPDMIYPGSVSPDGKYLLTYGPGGVQCLVLNGDGKPVPMLDANGRQVNGVPRFSPDGKWFSYMAMASGGQSGLLIRSFEDGCKSPGNAVQVAFASLTTPRWRQDGNEIFFRGRDRNIHAVGLTFRGREIVVGQDKQVFGSAADSIAFDVAADGKRAILAKPTGPPRREVLTLIQNWTAKLK